MRVLVTGARGQLGAALCQSLAGHDVFAASRPEVDVASYDSAMAAADRFGPDVVVHAAAHTDVDGCELDPDLAYRVNALGTQNVALAARRSGAALVAVSTDYVFDGTKGEPYLEFDEPRPLSVYGRSKLAGERYAQTLHDRVYVVRTSWVFSATGKNFPRTVLRLSEQRDELAVVDDERGCPTFAADLAAALAELIRHPLYGVYHLANEGGCSRFELAVETLRLAGRPTRVSPVSAAEYLSSHPLPARRPADSRLRNFCAATALGIRLRPWREALADVLRAI